MARGRVETFTGYFPALRRENNLFTAPPKKRYPSPKSGRVRILTSKRVSDLTGIHEFQTYKPHRLAHSRLADAVLSAVLSVTVAR